MSNETPRTDAILPKGSASNPEVQHVALELAGLARQLERENRELREALGAVIDLEGYIRIKHSILGDLGWPEIRRECRLAVECIRQGGVEAAERNAQSFGL